MISTDLIIALPAGEEAPAFLIVIATPDLARDDEKEDDANAHMGAVKARDHEERRAELRRAQGIGPGPDAFVDQLRPFESLHADEGGAEQSRHQHQDRRLPAVAAIAEIHRHRHRPAAADQHEGHDRDQDEGKSHAADGQSEDFAGIGPRHGRGHARGHVGDQETAEDEGVAEEKDPHHGLSPGHIPERLPVRREIGRDALQPRGFRRSCQITCQSLIRHIQSLSHVNICRQMSTNSPAQPVRMLRKTSQTSSRKCQ